MPSAFDLFNHVIYGVVRIWLSASARLNGLIIGGGFGKRTLKRPVRFVQRIVHAINDVVKRRKMRTNTN